MTYIKVFTDFLEDMERLNDEEVGRLFRAMLLYGREGTLTDLPGREGILWPSQRKMIEREAENYQKTCERNKKNRAGGKKASKSPSAEPVD